MIPESVTPEGLRARAEMVRSDSPCDRTSTARHIDLAADEIEQLQAENRKLILAMVRIDYESKCDWCADIAKSVLPDVMPTHVSDAKSQADTYVGSDGLIYDRAIGKAIGITGTKGQQGTYHLGADSQRERIASVVSTAHESVGHEMAGMIADRILEIVSPSQQADKP